MTVPLVTGLGCISALGEGASSYWRALTAGEVGLSEIRTFPSEGLRNTLAGVVRISPGLSAFAEAEGIASRLHLFAFAAIDEALADAAIDIAGLRLAGRKVALVAGTSLGMSLVAPDKVGERLTELEGDDDNADLGKLGEVLERRYGLPGEVTIVSTACASATHAIGLARDMIRHDGYDVVVAGGADSLDRMKYLGHSALSTLTTGYPRPFSSARDGTLFAEGAGFLVLEADRGEGRQRYAACTGAGYSTDVYHVTAPDPEGSGGAMAMEAALADAGLEPHAVDHVNLHGSGTPLNDSAEYNAMTTVFGAHASRIPSTSIKAAIGHVMGAAGGLEAVATVLSLKDGIIPPTVNVAPGTVDFDLDLVTERSRRAGSLTHALSNSFGFGGANGVVVFSR